MSLKLARNMISLALFRQETTGCGRPHVPGPPCRGPGWGEPPHLQLPLPVPLHPQLQLAVCQPCQQEEVRLAARHHRHAGYLGPGHRQAVPTTPRSRRAPRRRPSRRPWSALGGGTTNIRDGHHLILEKLMHMQLPGFISFHFILF